MEKTAFTGIYVQVREKLFSTKVGSVCLIFLSLIFLSLSKVLTLFIIHCVQREHNMLLVYRLNETCL